MATKSITITEEAYERLASFKEDKESFSDVVNKLTKRHSILDLAGLLTNTEADELEKNIKDMRKRTEERMGRIAEQLK